MGLGRATRRLRCLRAWGRAGGGAGRRVGPASPRSAACGDRRWSRAVAGESCGHSARVFGRRCGAAARARTSHLAALQARDARRRPRRAPRCAGAETASGDYAAAVRTRAAGPRGWQIGVHTYYVAVADLQVDPYRYGCGRRLQLRATGRAPSDVPAHESTLPPASTDPHSRRAAPKGTSTAACGRGVSCPRAPAARGARRGGGGGAPPSSTATSPPPRPRNGRRWGSQGLRAAACPCP
jgi:hypothetical protein